MDAAQAVKEKLPIEDVVGEYVTLKRAGRNLKGLCPFHSEKTPSFMVNPERGIYHCFGCNEGGDALAFVMKMEGLDFRQTLELLARKAGVDLGQYGRGSGETKRKEKIYTILELSTKYYQTCLIRNQHALDYARRQRGLSKDSLTAFRIGYAPTQGDALVRFLTKRGYSMTDLRGAGLVTSSGTRPRDLFRSRLMLPLADGQGKIVGFTGRLLYDTTSGPKYLNSPQTIVYDKSRHIYGLHLAKQAIRLAQGAVMVEGNMDVVASHQAGITNVVATAGTALTLEQLRQLTRLAETIILAFDNDEAGLKATIRGIELAQKVETTLMVAPLRGGKDADELVRQNPAQWQKVIDEAVYALDWLLDHYTTRFDVTSAPGKRQLNAAILPLIGQLSDPVEQEHYLKRVAGLLDVSLDALRRRLAARQTTPARRERRAPEQSTRSEDTMLLDSFLGLLICYPMTRLSLDGLDLPELDSMRRAVFDYLRVHPEALFEPVPPQLQDEADFVKILVFKAEELYGRWGEADRTVEAIELAQRIGKTAKRKQLGQLSKQIEAAESRGDESEIHRLLTEYQQRLIKE